MTDQELMALAFAEAAKGGRAVRPNPRVGCAIRTVRGEVVAGYHKRFGGAHAEVEALEELARRGFDAKGATVAVTLEPCCHHGKTPPCTDALIKAGVGKVLVAIEDPFVRASGKGADVLWNAGIAVEIGLGKAEGEALNREWLYAHRVRRPFVTLKMATSLDGLWAAASGESKWITGPGARQKGHELRSRVDAIVTSSKTVEADDPELTARMPDGKLYPNQPRVFVLSKTGEPDLSAFKVGRHPGWAKGVKLEDLEGFLRKLHADGVHDVLVEAGPGLATAFLEGGFVSELWIFQGPRLLGGSGAHLGALAGGRLPGMELKVLQAEQLPEGDLFLRAVPGQL
jgi:diaminohydroxyphosphoribosylaminopyrimidine deaminase/5-amino-6-(5-phosphoribosylamino)uracil reductase